MLQQLRLKETLRIGLIGGIVAIYLCLVGLVGIFGERAVIGGVISLGHTWLLLTMVGTGYVAGQKILKHTTSPIITVLTAAIAGLVAGSMLAGLVILGNLVNLRAVLLHASPRLYSLLTFGQGLAGTWLLPAGGAMIAAITASALLLPPFARRLLLWNLIWLLALGLFAGLLRVQMVGAGGLMAEAARFLFGTEGLTVAGALLTVGIVTLSMITWSRKGEAVRSRIEALPPTGRRLLRLAVLALVVAIVLILPQISGPFIAQVIVFIGLYVLMALGLNLELGFAGLLDLGFVAFFAIGAYTVGLLTSVGYHGIAHWSFWAAVPIAVLVSLVAGVLLGIPVLGIRGDYLAIATLGFGEIVRLLVLSDFLKPWLGGSQGVLAIQKPCLGTLGPFQRVGIPMKCYGLELAGPQYIYYLIIIAAVLVAFVAWRLRDSRLGRAWMAIREDEDVAEALGVNLVQSKLLAYGLGAAFAGLSGAIFAVLVGSIFPHSMQLMVSINVVAVIVIGGMGSIPGVIVGALVLIGLPELFREFAEYRLLFYGAALIATMLTRPEGLWPSAVIQRELRLAKREGSSAISGK
jgi:branched-chain amino acid transport system permease protein